MLLAIAWLSQKQIQTLAANDIEYMFGVSNDTLVMSTEETLLMVTTDNATNVTVNSARLNGVLNSMDASSATVSFQWGTCSGNHTGETPAQSTNATGAFYADLSNLTPNTEYYYRARTISGNSTANGVERSFTTAPAISMVVSVGLQGGSRPDPGGWSVPLTVKLFTSGNTTLTDVLKSTPDFSFDSTAAKSGSFARGLISNVLPGTYDISVTSPHCLINVKRGVVLNRENITLDLGTLLEGNANNDEMVNISDFGLLAMTYGKQRGQDGFDERADFDRNDIINITDFGVLAANYGKYGPIEIPKTGFDYLENNLNSTINLIRESPDTGSPQGQQDKTYWLSNDNLLASYALKYFDPELATTLVSTIEKFGYHHDNYIEILSGNRTVEPAHAMDLNPEMVADTGAYIIKNEKVTGTIMPDYDQYLDKLCYEALWYAYSGNHTQADILYNQALSMWDGKGFIDKPFQLEPGNGYATYKLAVFYYTARVLGKLDSLTFKNTLLTTINRLQDANGGYHTSYYYNDGNLTSAGSTNTETTSLVLMALYYQPLPIPYS